MFRHCFDHINWQLKNEGIIYQKFQLMQYFFYFQTLQSN